MARKNCVILGDVKDMESPSCKIIELLIYPWLVAFSHLGGPLAPLTSCFWPPNVALQAPWLVAFSKPSKFIIGSFTESFMKSDLILLRYCQFTSYFLIFCLNIPGIPTVRFTKSFMKIWLNLAKIFSIQSYFLVFVWILLGYPQ